MRLFDLMAVLLVLAAGFSYLNLRFVRLPPTIGLMALTLAAAGAVVLAGQFVPAIPAAAEGFVRRIDFDDAVLHGMLGFLLFAGALHVKLDALARWRLPVAVMATAGVLLSTAVVGGLTYLLLTALSLEARFLYCRCSGRSSPRPTRSPSSGCSSRSGRRRRWRPRSPASRCSTTGSGWWCSSGCWGWPPAAKS